MWVHQAGFAGVVALLGWELLPSRDESGSMVALRYERAIA